MWRGRLALAAMIALVVAALLLTLRGFEPPAERAGAPESTMPPRYELRDTEWTRLDAQGRTELHATAASAQYFDDKSAQLNELALDRLGGEGGPWHVTAPRGRVPPNEPRIQLNRPVTMIGKLREGDDVRIDTDLLWVDWQRRELYTERAVRLSGATRSAHAVGLRADWAGERVQLLHDVEVQYEMPR